MLACVLALLGVGLLATWKARENARQRDAIAALERVGASFMHRYSCPEWMIDLVGFEWIVRAGVFARLDSLRLSSSSEITTEDLAPLKELSSLRLIDLSFTDFQKGAFASISSVKQLEDLDLSNTNIGDSDLFALANLVELEKLNLCCTAVSDAGVAYLKRLTNLENLDLTLTRVGDAGLKHLMGLHQLRRLDLVLTPVTDAGLVHLTALKKLETLDLSNSQVSELGVKQLRSALPATEIVRDLNRVTPEWIKSIESKMLVGKSLGEMIDLFGFPPDDSDLDSNGSGEASWDFVRVDGFRFSIHGNGFSYVGKFHSGRLTKGSFFVPL